MFSSLFETKRSRHDEVPFPDLDRLAQQTHFSANEIRRIYKRFCAKCREDGTINILQFSRFPEVVVRPILIYAFQKKASQGNGTLSFNETLALLSSMSPFAEPLEKQDFLFDGSHDIPFEHFSEEKRKTCVNIDAFYDQIAFFAIARIPKHVLEAARAEASKEGYRKKMDHYKPLSELDYKALANSKF